jgi:hypothetical protein
MRRCSGRPGVDLGQHACARRGRGRPGPPRRPPPAGAGCIVGDQRREVVERARRLRSGCGAGHGQCRSAPAQELAQFQPQAPAARSRARQPRQHQRPSSRRAGSVRAAGRSSRCLRRPGQPRRPARHWPAARAREGRPARRRPVQPALRRPMSSHAGIDSAATPIDSASPAWPSQGTKTRFISLREHQHDHGDAHRRADVLPRVEARRQDLHADQPEQADAVAHQRRTVMLDVACARRRRSGTARPPAACGNTSSATAQGSASISTRRRPQSSRPE